ncbi:MAG TPA: metallophosphoesterase family protein [Chthoniobacterales bacterium]|jgi:predicted phosphodiesterase
MRIAVLYDIHGNLPALEAVLEEIEQLDVDRIVIGGDVVPGPMPRETLYKLSNLRVPTDFIHGNGEIAVLKQMAGQQPSAVPQQFRPIIEWTGQQFDCEQEQLLKTWPRTIRLDLPSLGPVLFCHATPRNENEIFTRATPEDRLKPIFEGIDAATAVCGHTHMQFDRFVGATRVINAGSVGMPFGRAGAYWLLLGPDVQLRHTPYDLEAAATRIRRSSYPQAQQFAQNNILNPPSEEQMLEAFAKAESAAKA